MKIKFLLTMLFVVGLAATSMAQSTSVGPRLGFTSAKGLGIFLQVLLEGHNLVLF
jgi:hypothetical protein